MVKITEVAFKRTLAHLLPLLGKRWAVTGAIAAQGYLFEWFNKDPRRVRLLIHDAMGIEVIVGNLGKIQLPDPLVYVSPEQLEEFSPDYKAMIECRNVIKLPLGSSSIPLPVVPADYLVAMGLCSGKLLEDWYTMALVKIGRDTERLDGERVRGILKSVGRAEVFGRYKEMVYDL